MTDRVVFEYVDPENSSRYMKLIDDGVKVRFESSIEADDGALKVFEALVHFCNANQDLIQISGY